MPLIHKLISLPIIIGISTGLLSSAFLHALHWATHIRQENLFLLWGLPIFAILMAILINKVPKRVNYSIHQVLTNDNTASPWTALYQFFTSLGTHLFGGSAGREGVGVLIGISLSQLIPKLKINFLNIENYLIACGISAGFSAIFGTPLAGIFFALELKHFNQLKPFDLNLLLAIILSAFIALFPGVLIGPGHQTFEVNFQWNWLILAYIIIAGLGAGIGGNLYYWGLMTYSRVLSGLIKNPMVRMFVGSLLILFVVYFSKGYSYLGLGTDIIAKSFYAPMSLYDFSMKCLLTIMTLSLGFKGGEVTPLFFMGATLSNALATIVGLPDFSLSAALGMLSLFGALSGTTFTCGLMGAELFGWEVGLGCLVSSFIGKKLLFRRSLY